VFQKTRVHVFEDKLN